MSNQTSGIGEGAWQKYDMNTIFFQIENMPFHSY